MAGNDSTGAFVDFAAFQNVSVTPRKRRGAVVKADSVTSGTHQTIAVEARGADEPGIILHRNGDEIEKIEFVCPCGRHSEISIEYDDEANPA